MWIPGLDLHVRVLVQAGTTSVLSLGRLVDESGFDFIWRTRKVPYLTKGRKKVWCYPSNFVPFLDSQSYMKPVTQSQAAPVEDIPFSEKLKQKEKEEEERLNKESPPYESDILKPANTWTRYNKQATHYQRIEEKGKKPPPWSTVYRRVTVSYTHLRAHET